RRRALLVPREEQLRRAGRRRPPRRHGLEHRARRGRLRLRERGTGAEQQRERRPADQRECAARHSESSRSTCSRCCTVRRREVLSRLVAPLAFPSDAARLNQNVARTMSAGTPLPFAYRTPMLFIAWELPACAARRYQLAAAFRSRGTPCPFS